MATSLPLEFENMSPTRKALTVALHELTTFDGLTAYDGAAPGETFEIDASEAVKLIEEALRILGDSDSRPS